MFQTNLALAWNASGHQLMAAISWDMLSNEQQNYWVDILKQHPRFGKDFKNRTPRYVKQNPKALNEWIFRQAATWPDLARGFHKNEKDKYHHGSWHYINYPIYLNKKIDTNFLNLNTEFENKLHNGLNIVQALKGNIKILSKKGATKKEKAIALSWVLHLVGDTHQPLHSTALFSNQYFMYGDRGGNMVKISGQGRSDNLHWYWDSTLNNTVSFKIIDLKAKNFLKRHKKRAIESKNTSINQWLINANEVAKKYAYPKQLIETLKTAEMQNKEQPVIYISNSYNKQARRVAGLQIVEASYKLIEILKVIK